MQNHIGEGFHWLGAGLLTQNPKFSPFVFGVAPGFDTEFRIQLFMSEVAPGSDTEFGILVFCVRS
ncbi:hypothetical protein [Cytobacillus firmus]|uniref:hypothetical protein n=1 Tax=Cytobacillus firmus TaxID=1399 RepID=UPI00203ADB21|nr:hypothetical protein [Cytobacillus firmus]